MSVIDTREEPILKIETKEIIAQCGSDPSQVIAGLYRRIVDDGDLRSLKRSRWSAPSITSWTSGSLVIKEILDVRPEALDVIGDLITEFHDESQYRYHAS